MSPKNLLNPILDTEASFTVELAFTLALRGSLVSRDSSPK